MIKGVGRRVILLNNTESELFDQAIFILKQEKIASRQDIIKECERMINQNIKVKKCAAVNKWKVGFFILLFIVFLLGIYCVF